MSKVHDTTVIHGVGRTDYFYRISLKAIIRNDKGEVLVVKEKGSDWNLPGGGMEHDEDMMVALARELYEEVKFRGSFTATLISAEPMYIEELQFWQMWLVYEIDTENDVFELGEDADEIKFINPEQFRDSGKLSEQLVYKHSRAKESPSHGR